MIRSFLLAHLVYALYTVSRWTWRVQIIEPRLLQDSFANNRPVILAHWHGDELALVQLFGMRKICTIVSTSKDGEIMNRFIHLLGGETSRGSSTRGGVGALKGLIRLVRAGWTCSFAVDGPKGPIHKVKPGVFEVAKILDLPIYWAGVHCDRAFQFPKSWNKTYFPKPFARITIQWFGPFEDLKKDVDPRDERLAESLETKLHAAKQQVLPPIASPS